MSASVEVPRLATRTAWRRSLVVMRLGWRAHRPGMVLLVLLALLGSALPVGIAWLTMALLNSLGDNDGTAAAHLALSVAVLGVIGAVLPFVSRCVTGEFDRRVGYLSQAALFESVNRLPGLSRLEEPHFHDRLRLAQQASRLAPGRGVDALLGIGQALLTVGGFLGALVSLNGWLALLVLATAAPLLPVEIWLSRGRVRLEEAVSRIQRREAFYQGLLTRLDAAKEIRLFGLGGYFRDKMLAEARAGNRLYRRLERRQLGTRAVMAACGMSVVGGGLLWLFASEQRTGLSAGAVTLFLASAVGVHGGVQMICNNAGLLHEMLLLMGHYEAVTTAESDLERHPGVPLPSARGSGIEFRDVWFRYGPDLPWVLRGVSFVLRPGTAVGLVGVNGAGKSTIVKLLCRFYDPTRGAITWDGVDVRTLDVDVLRQRIGVVFQDFMDYDLTARENIAVGDLSALADRDRIVRAARDADIHSGIESLPKGYDTLLSRVFVDNADRDDETTGVVLSGGQWQRIALARAFLRHHRDLLILDEPSSGLDAEAEYEMHQRLRRLRDGQTSLLISHRLNAIRQTDHILVIDDGRVVEEGSHDRLLEDGGRYARLFGMQAAGYRADVPSTRVHDVTGLVAAECPT